MKKFCDHNWAEQDTAIACDGLCPLCLQNENERLKKLLKDIKRWNINLPLHIEGLPENLYKRVEQTLKGK